MTEIIIDSSESGKTLEKVLKDRGYSRRLITLLKRQENGMTRQGQLIRTIDTVKENDVIILDDCKKGKPLEPNGNINVEILYEDKDLVVFNKPPLMPVHPSINHQGDTLGNFFSFHCPNLTFRPVNRLDRDTSGCVIVAKNPHAAHILQNKCEKKYFCITKHISLSGGRICAPIAREKESIILRCVRSDGQYSVTNWLKIKDKNDFSLLEINLETGRTHQIRVHLAWKGYPLLGDKMYGGDCKVIERQALHCGEISFFSPGSNKKITVKAPLPEDMAKLIE